MTIKNLIYNKFFIFGLIFRLILIASVFSLAINDWYEPFISFSLSAININPWEIWLESGGSVEAFPYGYVLWLTFIPAFFIFKLFGLPAIIAYFLTILVCDFLLLAILSKLIPGREKLILFTYWLSPVVLLATYGYGFNDIVPVLFLMGAVLSIKNLKMYLAGFLLAAAVSAKLSMVIAAPFFMIYLYNNKSLRCMFKDFFITFLATVLILVSPFIFSDAGRVMLFQNPELSKIYNLSFIIGDISIIIIPLFYSVALYFVWRFKRPNFDLFISTMGIAFLFVVLANPSSPGWFIWSIPFLALYQTKSGRTAILITFAYSVLYLVTSLSLKTILFTNGFELNLTKQLTTTLISNQLFLSLLHTSMVCFGVILAFKMYREAISLNNFYRLTRNPFVLGVAGDSGAGKDTYLDSIEDIFGKHSVVKISGDDYHLWDRQKPIWKNITHLNPMANDLESFSKDLITLIDGKSITTKHYNHDTGKMSRKFSLKSNDIIIAGGLHSFYLPILRECFNLKVFLDMDEKLRRHFKIQRDVNVRGHSYDNVLKSFEKRKLDSKKFISPQSKHADLIFSLKPVGLDSESELISEKINKFKLVITSSHGLNEYSIRRVLVGLCGLHVDITEDSVNDKTVIMVEGEVYANDIELASDILCPNIIEFLDSNPKWQHGMMGIMQLITLTHIDQALSRKFI